jgi:hypothetical protein
MPHYFFHLSFGQRVIPDEEGVELPDRSVARDEALTAVRELANPEIDGARRRWAGWFIQVADEEGQFLRLPIGHPALEIVRSGSQHPPPRSWSKKAGSAEGRRDLSDLAAQLSERLQHTAELVDRNRKLSFSPYFSSATASVPAPDWSPIALAFSTVAPWWDLSLMSPVVALSGFSCKPAE